MRSGGKLIRELSTPVIPVHDGILVVPLVGTIESTRSIEVMESLLQSIQRERAWVVILDITKVPTVDTDVGISPVMARTLVDLGVKLDSVVTRNNLQVGIAHALSILGLEIRPIDRRAN